MEYNVKIIRDEAIGAIFFYIFDDELTNLKITVVIREDEKEKHLQLKKLINRIQDKHRITIVGSTAKEVEFYNDTLKEIITIPL